MTIIHENGWRNSQDKIFYTGFVPGMQDHETVINKVDINSNTPSIFGSCPCTAENVIYLQLHGLYPWFCDFEESM